MLRVEPPAAAAHGNALRVAARLETSRGAETLWYELASEYAPYVLTERLDAFALVGLLIAMERGERELVLDGPVSEKLLYQLKHHVGPLVRLVTPGLASVEISAKTVDSTGEPEGHGVGTGFSGGIDSACTIVEHLVASQAPGYKLTHLLFCNVGSHDRGEAGRKLFRSRLQLLEKGAAELGLPLVVVDSNLSDLLKRPFEATLTPRTASVALLLQGLFKAYFQSSSHDYASCHFHSSPFVSYTDPVLAHQLSTESLQFISAGSRHSRVEKTRIALRMPGIRGFLNVCTHPQSDARNCSACEKCLRTLATLEMLGELEGFDGVFDLALYRQWTHRLQYLLLLPGRREDVFIQELYDLARRRDAALPAYVRAFHKAWPLVGAPYRVAKSIRRRRIAARQ